MQRCRTGSASKYETHSKVCASTAASCPRDPRPGKVRRGGQRAPLPALAWPGPGPCAGVRARTPARARPAPEAAERWPGPPRRVPGPRRRGSQM
ncbi:hypothetical protein QTO34_016690 [Cnephaeus nilssonii]|uniref:Uncharacterized protein n=1 Tax=Cnephaeus nilssonii TaxID=3371016 RepID=A0AA40LSE2_CNENI|nr:hypothetical protein QTO34_016690 [Eptesicus nilssonii]